MTATLLYIARASLYLAIFYAFFLLVMRRTSFFRFNRIALLLGTVVCHLLPLLRLRTVLLPESVSIQVGELEMMDVAEAASAPFPWIPVLYAAGAASVLVLSALSLARTRRIIRSGSQEPCDGCRLTLVERDVPSFSWGRNVVMSRGDYEKYPAILGHELQHIRAHHSLDILLMTAVNAVHWFNPLAWMARAELKLLHEYEADEGLIRKGIDATSYQLLLVRKAVGEQRFSLANGFNHAKLKQRITMMHKKQTPARVRFAYVAVLPVLAATMFVCNPARARIISAELPVAQGSFDAPAATGTFTAQNPPEGESVSYSLIEKKPTFNGGDAGAFSKWVNANLKYPAEAKADGIQGRVMVSFKICEDGVVRDVKVLRGVHELLDAEAVRVISASPKWEPGLVDGKPVNVTFSFPIVFKLSGDDEPTTGFVISVPHASESPISVDRSTPGKMVIRYNESGGSPLIFLDGIKYNGDISDIDPATISSMEVLKDEKAIEKYGDEAKNGVILITTKKQ